MARYNFSYLCRALLDKNGTAKGCAAARAYMYVSSLAFLLEIIALAPLPVPVSALAVAVACWHVVCSGHLQMNKLCVLFIMTCCNCDTSAQVAGCGAGAVWGHLWLTACISGRMSGVCQAVPGRSICPLYCSISTAG